MTTDLQASQVPVVYLSRSSIAKWNAARPQWNASTHSAHFGRAAAARAADGDDDDGPPPRPSAVFVAKK